MTEAREGFEPKPDIQTEKGGEIDRAQRPARRRAGRPAQLTWDPEGMNGVIDSELAKPSRGRRKLGRLIRSSMATDLTRPEPPIDEASRKPLGHALRPEYLEGLRRK